MIRNCHCQLLSDFADRLHPIENQMMRDRCRKRHSMGKCCDGTSISCCSSCDDEDAPPVIILTNRSGPSKSRIGCRRVMSRWSNSMIALLLSTLYISSTRTTTTRTTTITSTSSSFLLVNAYAFHMSRVRRKQQCLPNDPLRRVYHHYYGTINTNCHIRRTSPLYSSKEKISLHLSATSSSSSSTPSTTADSSSGNHTMFFGAHLENNNNNNGHNKYLHSNGKEKEEEEQRLAPSGLPVWLQKQVDANQVMDVPRPTEKGGYSHTVQSKAKISAANKGKVPWNKGRGRSEATRAKIAEGVRKRNRERFLKQLADTNTTEEEYNQQQQQEKAQQEAEKSARKTPKGGYRLTQETKQKISKILKEKWAKGEVKKRSVDPSKVRRGFKHSEETRAKISASLRKRWADDEEYRSHMMKTTYASNSKDEVRKRISESLRKKWQDPEFREQMVAKMATRKRPPSSSSSPGISHREKISAAMKKRWQDEDYRNRATQAMRKKQAELAKSRPPSKIKKKTQATTTMMPESKPRPVAVKTPNKWSSISRILNDDEDQHENFEEEDQDGPRLARPIVHPKRKIKGSQKKNNNNNKKVKQRTGSDSSSTVSAATTAKKSAKKTTSATTDDLALDSNHSAPKEKKKQSAGSKSRLREERRDLYDLLYGDEDNQDSDIGNENRGNVLRSSSGRSKASTLASVFLDDEDLDDYDPYGLEDF